MGLDLVGIKGKDRSLLFNVIKDMNCERDLK
jgi:hypothetical protein